MSDTVPAPTAPPAPARRSNATLAAFAGPCLPLAAFGVALPVTLPEYYATHVGIEIGLVGVVFMAVRLIDIFFDPMIGAAMDRTRTRFGRYRPWMAASTPVLMLAALMVFVMVKPGAGPIWSRVGSNAIASIAALINPTDRSNVHRRPWRSPTCPKNRAPSGRMR